MFQYIILELYCIIISAHIDLHFDFNYELFLFRLRFFFMSTILKVGAVLLPFVGNIPGSFFTKNQIKEWYNVSLISNVFICIQCQINDYFMFRRN